MTLPFLRVSRDKRGYENTFVIHTDRWRGRPRTRVLYWFRTPPGVKVGRSALDDLAIRRIEEAHPDVEFDWSRITKGGPEAAAVPTRADHEPRAPRPIPESRLPRSSAAPRPGAARPAPPEPDGPARDTPPARALPRRERIEPAPPPAEPIDLAEIPIDHPVALPETPADRVTPTAAQVRLGSEGLQRLKARHAELRGRIAERVPDPARQEQLNDEVERLNPDTWVTEDQVTLGLERYESVLESLRAVVGQGRRRRGREGRAEAGAAGETPATAGPAAAMDGHDGPAGDQPQGLLPGRSDESEPV